MVPGERTVDRKKGDADEKMGNEYVDGDVENMAVERYLIMGVAVE